MDILALGLFSVLHLKMSLLQQLTADIGYSLLANVVVGVEVFMFSILSDPSQQ